MKDVEAMNAIDLTSHLTPLDSAESEEEGTAPGRDDPPQWRLVTAEVTQDEEVAWISVKFGRAGEPEHVMRLSPDDPSIAKLRRASPAAIAYFVRERGRDLSAAILANHLKRLEGNAVRLDESLTSVLDVAGDSPADLRRSFAFEFLAQTSTQDGFDRPQNVARAFSKALAEVVSYGVPAFTPTDDDTDPAEVVVHVECAVAKPLLEKAAEGLWLSAVEDAGITGWMNPPPDPMAGRGVRIRILDEDPPTSAPCVPDEDVDAAFKTLEVWRERKAERETLIASAAKPLSDLDAAHEEYLNIFRGRDFVGITQNLLPSVDKYTLGLRQLTLLAGPPNVSKTMIGTQLGLGAVISNQDVGFLFASVEMDVMEIRTRIECHLAEVPWSTLVRGSKRALGPGRDAAEYFTSDEYDAIQEARLKLKNNIGQRIVVIDRSDPATEFSAKSLIREAEALKARTGVTRVLVLIDYLQLWPVPASEAATLRSELDLDRWRVEAMNELRRGLGPESAVVVISEARKPSNESDGWGTDMSDVMGSSRNTYSPSCVMMLTPASDTDIAGKFGLKSSKDTRARDASIREELATKGIALTRLNIVKGRDGMTKGCICLQVYFREHRIIEGWRDLPELISVNKARDDAAKPEPKADKKSTKSGRKEDLA